MTRATIAAGLAALVLAAPATAAEVAITVWSDGFSHPNVTVNPGDQVHWRNEAGESIRLVAADGTFDSEAIPNGGGFSLATSVPGEHLYTARNEAGSIDLAARLVVRMTRLRGNPGDLASDNIPDLAFPDPPAGDLQRHPEWGMLVSRSQIIVAFERDATVAAANAALAAARVGIVGGLPGSGLLLVQAPDAAFGTLWSAGAGFDALETALSVLRAQPGVELAAMSPAVDAKAIPASAEPAITEAANWTWEANVDPSTGEDLGMGDNYWLEMSRWPQAWNLREQADARVDTVIIDNGFAAGHPDLPALTIQTGSPQEEHGTHVAGIVGAAYDNRDANGRSIGISGANPRARMLGVSWSTYSGLLDTFQRVLDAGNAGHIGNLRVINYSGTSSTFQDEDGAILPRWANHPPNCGPAADELCTPNNDPAWHAEFREMGKAARRIAEVAADSDVAIVQAAANDSDLFCAGDPCVPHVIDSVWTSEFAWASANWTWAKPDPVFIVEAVDAFGTRASFSNMFFGRSVSAPGEGILSTVPGGYESFPGTSMAAPQVTALIGYLAAYAPNLSNAQMRDAIEGWAHGGTGAAPRIDAFASLLAQDGAARNLVDLNDSSKDGNRRVVLGTGGPVGRDVTPLAPDDTVDMRDFRRFRDAWLQSCKTRPSAGCPADAEIALDGADDHPKRDLNLDGCVSRTGESGGADSACPTPEVEFPRSDLNGDGLITRNGSSPFPRNADGSRSTPPGTPLTDLEVLQSQWGGADSQDEGWQKSDLDALMRSGDIEIHGRDFFRAGATEVDVEIRRVGGGPTLPERKVKDGEPSVATVPILTAPSKFEVYGKATVRGKTVEAAPQKVELRFGEDKRVDLCVAHLELDATSKALPADGSSTSEITATYKGCESDEVDGKTIGFALMPTGGNLASIAPTSATTDSAGKAKLVVTAGTQVSRHTLRATLELGQGRKLEKTLDLDVRPPLRIAYVLKQTNLEWTEGPSTTRWGLVQNQPDCVLAGMAYCIDEFKVDLVGPSEPTRVGFVRGLGNKFKLSEEIQNGFGSSSSSWKLSDAGGGNVRTGTKTARWSIIDPRKYQDYDLRGAVSAEENDDGLKVSGLQSISARGYLHWGSSTRGGPAEVPFETYDSVDPLMFAGQRDGRAFRFAADISAPLVFRRDSVGELKPYTFCGTFTTDLTSGPAYRRPGDLSIGPFWLTSTRSPNYMPGDRPMPAGPGRMKIRYAFGAAASYGSQDPVPSLPDCEAEHPPEPDFRFAPEKPDEGRVVHFTNLSTDPEGNVVRWHWSFGDGESSSAAEPNHIFEDNGTYSVTLTATDDTGLSASKSHTVVIENLPPEVEIDDAIVSAGQPLSISVRTTDPGKVDKQQLELIVGSTNPSFPEQTLTPSSGAISVVVSALPVGTYALRATVKDKDGASAKASATALVVAEPVPPLPPPPVALPSPTCATNVPLDAEEAKFLDLLNAYRRTNDLPVVGASPTLTRAAEVHAQDMADKNFFEHTGSDRSSPVDRAIRARYPGNAIAENIAKGTGNGLDVLFVWRASTTGHNENMLDARWRAVGISRVKGSDWLWATTYGDVLDCNPPPGSPPPPSLADTLAPAAAEESTPAWPPTAALGVTADRPRLGDEIRFVNRSRDADGLPLAATLNLGDGSPGVALAAGGSHAYTYATSGAFVATLTTTDSAGQRATVRRNVFVQAPPSPLLQYVGDTQGVVGRTASLKARARDSLTGNPVAGLAIEFQVSSLTTTAITGADGIASASLQLDLTPGSWRVDAIFRGNASYGPFSAFGQIQVVQNTPPVADTGGPYPVGVGEQLVLSGGSSFDPDAGDRIDAFEWDLNGDEVYGELTGAAPRILPWADVQTLVCGGTCAAGTPYPIGLRVRDTRAGEGTARTTVTFVQDFGLFVDPAEKRIVPGTTNRFTVTVVGGGGFASPVTLSIPSLPTGVTASFSPNPVTPTGVSTLSITAAAGLPGGGTFPLTVRGVGGGLTRETTDQVEVAFGLVPVCYGRLTGLVTDSQTGNPLVGAIVTLGTWPNDRLTATNDSGRYVFDKVALGPNNAPLTYPVEVSKIGYWRAFPPSVLVTCGPATRRDATMVAEIRPLLTGRIVEGEPDPFDHSPTRGVTPTDRPISGAFVRANNAFLVSSDADGRYSGNVRLSQDNAPLSQVVQVAADSFWTTSKTYTAEAGVAKQVDFALVKQCYGVLHGGTVRYKSDGAPVEGAIVSLKGVGSRTTGPDGRYSFEGVPVPLGFNNSTVQHSLTVQPGPLAPPGSVGETATFTLFDCGSEASKDLVVNAPTINRATIEGFVTDEETHAPIAGASIDVFDAQSVRRDVVTDGAGHYRIENYIVGFGTTTSRSADFRLDATGYWFKASTRTVTTGSIRFDFDLLRVRTGLVSGRVTDRATGAPIERAGVSADNTVYTGPDGRYSTPVALGTRNAPRTLNFLVLADGYWGDFRTLTIGTTPVTADYQLLKECRPARIVGVVVNAVTQEPISGALVEGIHPLPSLSTSVLTNSAGRFELNSVRLSGNQPWQVQVRASKVGFLPQTKTVTVFCGATIALDFGKPQTQFGAVTGLVKGAGGNPLPGVFVGSEWGAATTTGPDGRYRLDGAPLAAGNGDREWHVTVAPDGMTARTKAVTVRAGADAVLDFDFSIPENRAPSAQPATASATEDTPAALLLSADDPDGDLLTYQVLDSPDHGMLEGTAPAFTYVPNADFNGVDSLTFVASDGQASSSPATIFIVVGPVNDAPRCVSAAAQGDEDNPITGSLACTDVEGDPLTYRGLEWTTHGVLGLEAGAFTYEPLPDFNGGDGFRYVANDGRLDSKPTSAELTINPVNDMPIAFSPALATEAGSESLAIDLAGYAIDIETSPGDLEFQIVRAPEKGTLTGTGSLREYRLDPRATGTDSFEFLVRDRGDPDGCDQGVPPCAGPVESWPGTVTISISTASENHPPTVTLTGPSELIEGAAPVTLEAHADDADGDALSYTWSATGGVIVANGATATFSHDDGPASPIVRVEVSDGSASADAEHRITVSNAPPSAFAGPDRGVYWGVPLALAATTTDPSETDRGGLQTSWRFDDGTPMTAGPFASHAYAEPGDYAALFRAADKDGGLAVDAVHVAVERRPTAIEYTGPASTDVATPTLTARLSDAVDSDTARLAGRQVVFAVEDGPTATALTNAEGVAGAEVGPLPHGTQSVIVLFVGDRLYETASETTELEVTAINNVPAAVDDEGATDEDTALTLGAGDLVANDTDPDGDALRIVSVTPTSTTHGSVTLSGEAITYTPAADFNGLASFAYEVSDGRGGRSNATVHVTVRPVNDTPTVTLAAPAAVDEGAPPAALAATAGDVDGDALTYEWTGNVIGSGTTATFAADDGPASAVVRVTVSDGRASRTAERTIAVRNATPSAAAGADSVATWGLPVTLAGTATDPSAADRAAGLRPTWAFGDGSPTAPGLSVAHAYAAPGVYTATLTATDKDGGSANDSATVTVGKRASGLSYTGPASAPAGSVRLSATLADAVEAGTGRVAGRTVLFQVGGQTASATTSASGVSEVVISLTAGDYSVGVHFDEDDHYLSSTASAPLVVEAVATPPPPPAPPPPPPPRQVLVDGVRCSIVGTEGPDVLTGTKGDDVICGLGGDDRIDGLAGNDKAYGGAGADLVVGGPGRDLLRGSAGRDRVLGGAGNDNVGGQVGDDYVDGGTGNDIVNGFAGNDVLVGGAGNDKLGGTGGNDRLRGGGGTDFLSGGGGNDLLRGEAGADALRGGAGSDRAFGGAGNDDIGAGAGAANVLRGEAGDDELDAINGARDDVDGGPGRDRALVDGVLDVVRLAEDVLRR